MKPTEQKNVKTDISKDGAALSQLGRKPLTTPVPLDAPGKAPLKSSDLVDADAGAEAGVEDEVAYVVAEGTPNGDLAGASGLFGGAAAGALGPAGLAAAGLAGLGLLAGSGGGDSAAAPVTPSEPPPAIPPVMEEKKEEPKMDPPAPESTGVAGATIAGADRFAEAGAPDQLTDGMRDFAAQADSGADNAEQIPGAGASANQIVGQVESDGSPSGIVGGLGSFADNDPSGTFSADVIQGGADMLPVQPEMAGAIDPALGEALSDVFGNTGGTGAAPASAESPADLLTAGVASTISSTADTLTSGAVPVPPAV